MSRLQVVTRATVEMALSQYDVDFLVLLWKNLTVARNEALLDAIRDGLPGVCLRYGLAADLNLRALAEAYDEIIVDKREGTLEDKLHFFVEERDWPRIRACLRRGVNADREAVNAAEKGDLHLLQFLVANGFDLTKNVTVCSHAAWGGHFGLLIWARENGADRDSWTCAYAAKSGRLDILKWVRNGGCEWDKWTTTYAAEGGHLRVLIWARNGGCPWTEAVCAKALENKHFNVLRWAVKNRCPGWRKYTQYLK